MALLALLAACGGGKGTDDAVSSGDTSPTGPAAVSVYSAAAASRFLAQASFGPTSAEISRVQAMSYSAWIDEQFAKPQALHRDALNLAAADLAATGQMVSPSNFYDSYWAQAVGGPDQLRQRAAFALSQIFVISFNNDTLRAQPRGVASYYDMLGANAFGNFRDLLESVALHPMMGVYLSHLKNQ